MNKTLRPQGQSHQGYVVQNLQTLPADSIQRVWITSQVQPRQDLTILAYRQVHLPVSVPVLSFELWQLSYFGAGFAVAALLALMVVLLLALLLLLLFVEPLLTALLQTKRLQPSSAIRIVLKPFLLMMMIVYGMLLSFLSSSFCSSVCCFCRYCCYHGIMHLSIVVEIIHHIAHWSANTMNKRISMIERRR